MIERSVIAVTLIAIGLLAYRGLLLMQRRQVAQQARRAGSTQHTRLLIFTSPTCAPCKLQQLPIIDHLLREWPDQVDFQIIDVAEQPEVAARYGVWSVPTTMVLDGRQNVIAINQGVVLEKKLREQLLKAGPTVAGDLVRVQSAKSQCLKCAE
jgi:thioredoxin 1